MIHAPFGRRVTSFNGPYRAFGWTGVRNVVSTIDPDGTGAFASLATWYAAMVSEYVSPIASNTRWIAECISSGGSADILDEPLILGDLSEEDELRNIVIRAGSGHSAYGKWDTSRYRLATDGSAFSSIGMLEVRGPFTEIRGLQVLIDHTNKNPVGFNVSNQCSNGLFWGCMFNGNATARNAIRLSGSGKSRRVVNCLAFDCGDPGGDGFVGGDDETDLIQFCTVAGSNDSGFVNGLCTNCLSSGNGGDDFASQPAETESDYNAAEDTTAPGDNSRQSQTFTFNDPDNDDYRLHADDAGAQNFGTPISDVPYDIAGVLRDPTNPSIGACEVAVA